MAVATLQLTTRKEQKQDDEEVDTINVPVTLQWSGMQDTKHYRL